MTLVKQCERCAYLQGQVKILQTNNDKLKKALDEKNATLNKMLAAATDRKSF